MESGAADTAAVVAAAGPIFRNETRVNINQQAIKTLSNEESQLLFAPTDHRYGCKQNIGPKLSKPYTITDDIDNDDNDISNIAHIRYLSVYHH